MGGKAGVKADARRQNAQAIGADDAQLRACSERLQLRFKRVLSVAGRVRRDDDGDWRADVGGLFSQRQNVRARGGDDDDIWRLGKIGKACDAGMSVNLAVARIDKVNGALEPAIAQILMYCATKAARPRARADERNGARIKQAVKIANAHGVFP
jgi:hypothetical protein